MLLTGALGVLLMFSPTVFISIYLCVLRLGFMIIQIGTLVPNYNRVVVTISSNEYLLIFCKVFTLTIGLLTLV